MYPASGDRRNAATRATSSAVAGRPSGMERTMDSSTGYVSTHPGNRLFIRNPRLAYCWLYSFAKFRGLPEWWRKQDE